MNFARSFDMLVNGQNNVDSKNGKVNEFSENIELVEEVIRRINGSLSKNFSLKVELICVRY